MRLLRFLVLSATLTASVARADGERAGVFDYYVLALSWSPNWCALEGDARHADQCETDAGWILHGLWPQCHRGWPAFCPTVERAPSRRMTGDMADIMGSGGLAWHQWNKHGSCSGLTASAYYELSRQAYATVDRPPVFRSLDKPVTLPAALVEEAFIKANPDLTPDMITVTCKQGHIQEARICLSKSLSPVPCGPDVVRDCKLKDAMFTPLR
jgi:ribonuclease T2